MDLQGGNMRALFKIFLASQLLTTPTFAQDIDVMPKTPDYAKQINNSTKQSTRVIGSLPSFKKNFIEVLKGNLNITEATGELKTASRLQLTLMIPGNLEVKTAEKHSVFAIKIDNDPHLLSLKKHYVKKNGEHVFIAQKQVRHFDGSLMYSFKIFVSHMPTSVDPSKMHPLALDMEYTIENTTSRLYAVGIPTPSEDYKSQQFVVQALPQFYYYPHL